MGVVETIEGFRAGGLNLAASLTNPTWGVGMSGIIEDFTPGEAKIALEGFISQGTLVTVEVKAYTFDGEILYCERRGSQYETHVSINDLDEAGLRRTPRFPVSLPGLVFSASLAAPSDAVIVDISGDGLGIELPVPLPLDSTIVIESVSNVAFGIVRFSHTLSAGRFRVGVQLHHIVQRPAIGSLAAMPRSGLMGKMGLHLPFARRRPDHKA